MKNIIIDGVEYNLVPTEKECEPKFKKYEWITFVTSPEYVNRFGYRCNEPYEVDFVKNGYLYFNQSLPYYGNNNIHEEFCRKITEEEIINWIYHRNKIDFKESDTVWYKGKDMRKQCGDEKFKVLGFKLVLTDECVCKSYLEVSLENIETGNKLVSYLTTHLELYKKECESTLEKYDWVIISLGDFILQYYVNRFGDNVAIPKEIDYIKNDIVHFTDGFEENEFLCRKATEKEVIDWIYYTNKIDFKEGNIVQFKKADTRNKCGYKFKLLNFELARKYVNIKEIDKSNLALHIENIKTGVKSYSFTPFIELYEKESLEDKIANVIEKYRNDITMTSHRIARFHILPLIEEEKQNQ